MKLFGVVITTAKKYDALKKQSDMNYAEVKKLVVQNTGLRIKLRQICNQQKINLK